MAYIGKQPTVGNFVKLDAITTSATTTFNLTNGGVAYYPQSPNHCLVSLNGILQAPTDSFTISGSTIIFSSALTTSDVIDFIIVLGDVLNIGTPSDATVGFSKITSNLITGATAETSIAGGDSVLIYDDSASALRKMTRTNFVAGIGGSNTPAFAVERTGAVQTLSVGSWTKIQFNNEILDSDNCFDSSTNYRFTPTTSGKYFIKFTPYIDGLGDAVYFDFKITKNGTTISYGQSTCGRSNTGVSNTISTIVNLNGSTDYIEAWIYHDYLEDVNNYTNLSGFKLIGA